MCAVFDKQNAELNELRWTIRSQSQQYASSVAVSQHVMVDTLNTASDWQQLAFINLQVRLNFMFGFSRFFLTVLYDKKIKFFV